MTIILLAVVIIIQALFNYRVIYKFTKLENYVINNMKIIDDNLDDAAENVVSIEKDIDKLQHNSNQFARFMLESAKEEEEAKTKSRKRK